MTTKMCPMLTQKQADPILCRHDCAWYVVIPPASELSEPREGCALGMLAREMCAKGATIGEMMLRLDEAIESKAEVVSA